MQQGIELSKRLLTSQSQRRATIWMQWCTLMLMVSYGLWTAYAVFRQRSYALSCVLIGCLLFLARAAIFHRAAYQLLFDGTNRFQRILNAGHYQLALSIVWHHYVIGTFFLLVAIFGSIQLLH